MPKTVFITGCSSGIGLATAKYFHLQGWNVVATMRNPEENKFLLEDNRMLILKLDVCETEQINLCFDLALNRFYKIDVLINNAGIGAFGWFENFTNEQIKSLFDTNILGLMQVTQKFIPHFKEKKNGCIVNVSSIAGRIAFPLMSIYNSSKYAVEGFSDSLAQELSCFGIKVRLIEPGPVFSEFKDSSLLGFLGSQTDNLALNLINNIYNKLPHMKTEKVAKAIYSASLSSFSFVRLPLGVLAYLSLLNQYLAPRFLRQFIIDRFFRIPK